ncbi:YbjN domain-containing protein [Rhizobiaceae bacterium]|nr:YbjN domain-containing protein [Rhizobiaceae bacterium]
MGFAIPLHVSTDHPLDEVERVADGNEWSFDREAVDEIAVHARGTWSDYCVSFSWVEHFEALHVTCRYDMRVPQGRHDETMRLLALVNEGMLFGHFDLWLQDGSVVFRHAIPLTGGAQPSQAQIEFLMSSTLQSCERTYQALQHVAWANQSAADALGNVLFDTVGEA